MCVHTQKKTIFSVLCTSQHKDSYFLTFQLKIAKFQFRMLDEDSVSQTSDEFQGSKSSSVFNNAMFDAHEQTMHFPN